MNHLVTITKSDGTTQLFEESKLVNSLTRVGASEKTIDEIVDIVGAEIKPGMTTEHIYRRAFDLLHERAKHVAIKYSIRRAIIDLGPDGFPFERFVSRIFKLWGYESLTDQRVFGKCVEHEVDVVAWKDDSLAMVEAKFHNEFGLRSDLKVALYVKARYDDLTGIAYDYGGRQRTLTEKWLITNTKFTDRAIEYGTCANLSIIGWNYPGGNNIHTIIEQNGLHPVTCITSLPKMFQKALIALDIITCRDLIEKPEVLVQAGVEERLRQSVIDEAEAIVAEAR